MNRKKLARRTALTLKIKERYAQLFQLPYRVVRKGTSHAVGGGTTRAEARDVRSQLSGVYDTPLVIERRNDAGQYVQVR